MIKYFRKIRQQLLKENKFSRYLFYAIGEIFLVVIGILIAMQINNLNKARIENKEEIKTYKNIKRQILEDKNEIIKIKNFNSYFSNQFGYANQIITEQDYKRIDTLAQITINLSQYSDFHQSGNIYETLVNSGDIQLLKNSDIVSNIQQLEMTYNQVNRLEDIHWEVIMEEFSPAIRGVINYSNLKVVKPKIIYSVEIQNIFIECIILTKSKEAVYNKALDEIDYLVELIDKDLKLN